MGPDLWFWVALVATVVLLVLALVSGLRGRRRAHLIAGPAAMVSLAIAILLTEQLAQRYVFPEPVRSIHLWCAKVGGLLAIPVILSGIWLWRRPAVRRLHRYSVFAFVVATLVATGTGIWMFSGATLR
ncbi:MAG: hypothetical protein ABL997_04300 [Planctomycetota bacterium]